MKRNLVTKLLCLVLASTVVATMAPVNFYTVSAETQDQSEDLAVQAEPRVVLQDGINDQWTQEASSVVGSDAVCAVEDGWLHIKSGSGNGNNPGTKPAMFVNPNEFNFDEAGYFEFTMKSANVNTSTAGDRFGVYLGYDGDSKGMMIGYDNNGWFWQKYGASGDPWYSGTRVAAPAQNTEVKVKLSWTADKKVTVEINGATVFTAEDFSGIADLGNKIAIKGGSYANASAVTNVYLKNIHYTGQAAAETYAVSGVVKDAEGNAIAGVKVEVDDQQVTTDASGNYTLNLTSGTYNMSIMKGGYNTVQKTVTVGTEAVNVEDIVLEAEAEVATKKLSTSDMDVYASTTFPSVVKYEMKKGSLKGKTFYGQTDKINTVKINGTAVELSDDDVKATFADNKATYVMTVKGTDIDAVITAELVAKDNTLAFNITKIENKLEDTATGHPIQTIEIPNQSLISVRSNQSGANFKGAAMSSNTRVSGDEYVEVTDAASLNQDYMYGFVSNDEMSAGLWSNSENDGRSVATTVTGGSRNTRVQAVTTQKGDYVSLGLGSTAWYYHRVVTDSQNRSYVVDETEMPKAKVIIAGDMNDDDQIDWQDGAVAFRSIMNNPYKSEEVPELVAYRIAMNFGGQAQNPFLTTLDNVKRVALNTDGLGQSVLLKGYANEGHDSAHPDYADIGKRIGGADDMNTLMTEGAKYGAKFGIHVNAGEMYPEAKAFKDDNVRRYADGSLRYGWNWLDQAVGLDSIYDLATGEREARFDALEKLVGTNLDFVYVDIWGNNTGSSNDDSWQTRKLSKEINDNGWRMANEWGVANEYDATFQHWATDLTYGGYNQKGENSEVMRFLRNHQKDSWVADYPSYGGAAMMPLLGGYNMKDFEGWQGRNDYDTYITNLYTHDLTTKFIQHYKIVKWVDGDPVTAGAATNWVPDMEITLKDNDGDTLVLTRGSNDFSSDAYRERTMTLNGKVIAQGAPSRGDRSDSDIQNGRNKGTESYLLPWIWDSESGEKVAASKEKLYHWNTAGGTTTWEVPDGWENLKNVKVYKLTDLGKTDEKTVAVKNGRITLEAESETPYVVCKGEENNLKITWSEGMHIVDAGFNGGSDSLEKNWKKSGDGEATIAKSQYSNPMLKLSGKVSMTQELTDLKAGQQYAVLVGIDNRSDAKAAMTVKNGDDVLATNYTTRSIAKNYVKAYTHSNSSATVDGSSYFQNMYVFFTAPESGKVTLTLSKEAGKGDSYFDDVRVVENDSHNITTNDKGEVVRFEQDFETNVQGIYPFVVGGIEGVEDNRIHLSERHDKYTQAGWDVKLMDDVLDGDWSVKINGLTQRSKLAYQTIPQNFRFEPGVTYKVSFDYQAGSDDTYGVVVGAGEYTGATNLETLKKSLGTTAHYEREIVGDITGQTWFGIYSTSTAPDLQGVNSSSAQANFGGYKELVLDNLVIEKVEQNITIDTLKDLIATAEGYNKEDYTAADWKKLDDALTKAKVAVNRDKTSADEIESAYYALNGAINYIASIDTNEESSTKNDISVEGVIATAGSEDGGTYGSNIGKAEYVLDNDVTTAWMTAYSGYATTIKNGEGWIDLQFPEAHTVDGLRYLPGPVTAGALVTIADYEIYVKTADSADYVKVSDGTWENTSSWKMAKFDPIENVTNVKLLAKSAKVYNWWAMAAEIRITSAAEATTDTEVVDKSGLTDALAEAKALNEADYTAESWAVLQTKIEAAEAVVNNADATNYDVQLALANLVDAISGLEAAETPEPTPADKDKLTEVVNNCAGLEEKNFTADSWKVYKAAYEKAMAVLADENASQADVDAAVAALKAAYAGLVKADDGNGGNNNQGNNNQGNNNKGDNVNKPGTPNNTNVAGKNNTTNKGTVKTGDTAPFMAMIVTILAAAGVIFGTVAQKTRRRRNRK